MQVRDVISVLEGFAPLSLQEKWDNSGLSVGSPSQEVHGILLGFDCTPELVDEAVEAGADMVITHHPLIFRGVNSIRPEDPVGLAIIKAVRAGVAIYASHTPSDKVLEGVSGAMARRLGLNDIEVLEPEGEGDTGFGAVGNLPAPLSFDQAVALVKEAFGLKVVRTSRSISGPISRVAMCGGSGSSMIAAAKASGAQLYLSGDVSYHYFFTPSDFAIMDIGHFEGEVEIVSVLYSLLRKNFPNFAVRVSNNLKDSNPIQYL